MLHSVPEVAGVCAGVLLQVIFELQAGTGTAVPAVSSLTRRVGVVSCLALDFLSLDTASKAEPRGPRVASRSLGTRMASGLD
jgi:hypothetical protein